MPLQFLRRSNTRTPSISRQERMTLFVFCNATSYRLQRYILERAKAENRHIALLFTGGGGRFFAEILQDAERLGADAFALDDEIELSIGELPWWPARRIIGWRAIVSTIVSKFYRVSPLRRAYARRLAVSMQLMKRLHVAVVVCSEDGISSDLAVMAAARNFGVPVVDIPFGNGTQYELEFELNRKRQEGRLNLAANWSLVLLRLLAPQWIKKGLYERAIMHPPEVIFAMESLGMTLRDAWIIHGGLSDVLCVESENSQRQYESEGIPGARFRLTGSPYCDVMVDSLRDDPLSASALFQARKIEAESFRVLVSWPPSYHDTYPGRNEFASYEAMTFEVFSFLKQLPGVRLSVSLHPACSDEVVAIFKKLGINIESEFLLKLIPAHDIFVTYYSSTIRWALAAGKVVVNYDAYDIKLRAYDSAPGFLNCENFDQLRTNISQLVSSSGALEDVMSRQIEVAGKWGVLDGECTRRIFSEIDMLTVD